MIFTMNSPVENDEYNQIGTLFLVIYFQIFWQELQQRVLESKVKAIFMVKYVICFIDLLIGMLNK
jgi:hypothetical protein